MKCLRRQVVPKAEARAATVEDTPHVVHLQILVLQRKRKLFHADIFPKALALKETTVTTLIPPLQFQVQVLLLQPLWSQQSLQTL